jgi:magnesium chelatase family protein
MHARQIQHERFRRRRGIHCNAAMKAADVQRFCVLSPDAQLILKQAVTALNLSARAYDRILKVSRTIADLAGSESIDQPHIHEAVSYRTLDRQVFE